MKNLIINTVDEEAAVERKRALKDNIGDSDEEMDNQGDRFTVDQAELAAMNTQTRQISERILSANISVISSSIYQFW